MDGVWLYPRAQGLGGTVGREVLGRALVVSWENFVVWFFFAWMMFLVRLVSHSRSVSRCPWTGDRWEFLLHTHFRSRTSIGFCLEPFLGFVAHSQCWYFVSLTWPSVDLSYVSAGTTIRSSDCPTAKLSVEAKETRTPPPYFCWQTYSWVIFAMKFSYCFALLSCLTEFVWGSRWAFRTTLRNTGSNHLNPSALVVAFWIPFPMVEFHT